MELSLPLLPSLSDHCSRRSDSNDEPPISNAILRLVYELGPENRSLDILIELLLARASLGS